MRFVYEFFTYNNFENRLIFTEILEKKSSNFKLNFSENKNFYFQKKLTNVKNEQTKNWNQIWKYKTWIKKKNKGWYLVTIWKNKRASYFFFSISSISNYRINEKVKGAGEKRSLITRIMLLLDTNPTFHITTHAKNHFSPFIFFFFFLLISTERRFDPCVSSLINSIDRNLFPFFFFFFFAQECHTGLPRT